MDAPKLQLYIVKDKKYRCKVLVEKRGMGEPFDAQKPTSLRNAT